jgi:hypothetical protein
MLSHLAKKAGLIFKAISVKSHTALLVFCSSHAALRYRASLA